ncbi:MAG: hypothetical protein AAGA43_15810 [Bacteroidota bacterium]
MDSQLSKIKSSKKIKDSIDESLEGGMIIKKNPNRFLHFLQNLRMGITRSLNNLRPSYKSYSLADLSDTSKLSNTELKYLKQDLKFKKLDTSAVDAQLKKNKGLTKLLNIDLKTTVLAKMSQGDNSMLIGYNNQKKQLMVSNTINQGIRIWKPVNAENLQHSFSKAPGKESKIQIKQDIDHLSKLGMANKELKSQVKDIMLKTMESSPFLRDQVLRLDQVTKANINDIKGKQLKIDSLGGKDQIFTVVNGDKNSLTVQPILQDKFSTPIKIDLAKANQRLEQVNTMLVSKLDKNIYLGFNNQTKDFKLGTVDGGKYSWKNQKDFLKEIGNSNLASRISDMIQTGDYILEATKVDVTQKKTGNVVSLARHNDGSVRVKDNSGKYNKVDLKFAKQLVVESKSKGLYTSGEKARDNMNDLISSLNVGHGRTNKFQRL